MVVTACDFSVRGGLAAVRDVRGAVGDWLCGMDVDARVVDDVRLALSELVTNAIEAAPDDAAEVQAELEQGRLHLLVTNNAATPFAWRSGHGRDPDAVLGTRGRGLQIAAAVAGSLEVATVDGRTEATFIRDLAGS